MKILGAVLAVVALTLVGLATALWGWAQGSPAEARTHARAAAIFNAMETYPGKTAYDQALEGARQGDVEVLVATVVVRLSAGADEEPVSCSWEDARVRAKG
jgi:hypothetical protein